MTFEEKIRAEVYNNPLPYGKTGTAEREEYQKRSGELSVAFHDDLHAWLLAQGVPEKYVDKVASRAYDDGHAYGYSEIFSHACSLAEIFE